MKQFNRTWYNEMKSQVEAYLNEYDNDIDTVSQVIENSPYISKYSIAYFIIVEMKADIPFPDIVKNAENYGVEDLSDDVALVNAMFLRVAEDIMSEV